MKAAAVALALLVLAGLAHAQPCSNSTKPACIALVGTNAGVPDPAGAFTITIHDCANNGVPGDTVTVDFADCGCGDVRVACEQPFPGMHVVCGAPGVPAKVWTLTDASGAASFCLVGGAQNRGGSPGAGAGCARAYSSTQGFLGSIIVQACDQDGSGGLNGADISAWLGDKFAPGAPYFARSDYDCDGSIQSSDLSWWLGVKFAARSTASATSSCCPNACP